LKFVIKIIVQCERSNLVKINYYVLWKPKYIIHILVNTYYIIWYFRKFVTAIKENILSKPIYLSYYFWDIGHQMLRRFQ
jgi:hypothetical protein